MWEHTYYIYINIYICAATTCDFSYNWNVCNYHGWDWPYLWNTRFHFHTNKINHLIGNILFHRWCSMMHWDRMCKENKENINEYHTHTRAKLMADTYTEVLVCVHSFDNCRWNETKTGIAYKFKGYSHRKKVKGAQFYRM